jgi:hypothetical protein
MSTMSNQLTRSDQVFSLLEGTWTGEGRGEYPTVTSFDYRETLTFTRRDGKSLAYEQRTYKRYEGQTEWLVSHWENGFIRILENGELELVNAQSGGRSEVLIGTVELRGDLICLHFASKAINNDPRMVCTSRTFELKGDALRYEVEMQTTAVDRLTHHLKIALQRIK